MNIFTWGYNEILFRPLFNLLVGIANILPTHSVGWAIIVVTLIVRLVLLPSSLHQAKSAQKNQDKMAKLQKELKRIQEQYKDDSTKQAEETMRLYREAGINPASGCLPLLIQLPILIALYRVFYIGLGPETYHYLYSFMSAPQAIQTAFFGIPLTQPSFVLGIIAGLGQFVLMRFFTPTPTTSTSSATDESAQMMAMMQKNMTYFFPVMTTFAALQVPAALALYWVASTVFGIAQQYIVKRVLHLSTNPPAL